MTELKAPFTTAIPQRTVMLFVKTERSLLAKDRITMLPESLKQPLRSHLAEAKTIHEKDIRSG